MKYFIFFYLGISIMSNAQQMPDTLYSPPAFVSRYPIDKGPVITIDEAHHNFHTAGERYLPFARLLKKDGYQVRAGKEQFSHESLKKTHVLVIANALHISNEGNWKIPTPSAFTEEEIKSLNTWVKDGGSLFLIADHMPFAGAAADLASAFGFRFYNGFAMDSMQSGTGDIFTVKDQTLHRIGIFNADSICTFTDQAFDIPATATPILTLSAKFKILLCAEAWNFATTTEKIDGNGKCQGAIIRYGKGRLAVFGEAGMFTAQIAKGEKVGMNTFEGKKNYLLLLGLIRWLDRD